MNVLKIRIEILLTIFLVISLLKADLFSQSFSKFNGYLHDKIAELGSKNKFYEKERNLKDSQINQKVNEIIPYLASAFDSELIIDSLVSTANDTGFQKMKCIYTYDANNRLETYIRETENAGIQKNEQSALLTYNTEGSMESITVVGWRNDGDWGNDYKIIFSYDNKGNEIQSIYKEWDLSTASWVNNSLSLYTYDENNNLIMDLYSEWDNGIWVDYGKIENSFDSNNNQVSQIIYWIDEDKWMPSYKLKWNYDSNNYLIEEYRFDWDTQTNTFINNLWVIYTLDPHNRKSAELAMTWDSTKNNWDNFYQDLFTYDEYGNKNATYSYLWQNDNWLEDFELLLVYYQEYLLSVQSKYGWDGTIWNDGRRHTFSYNEQGEFTKGVNEIWNGMQWEKAEGYLYLPKYYNVESFMSGLYALQGYEFDVYYQEVTDVETDKRINTEFTLHQNFPNPFNPITVIKYSIPMEGRIILKLFDILGREIVTLVDENQYPGNYSVDFDASILPSGVYFYKLIAGKYVNTKKMLLMQ